MLSNIKEIIKKNDRLYILARCIKEFNKPEFAKLIKGYYDVRYYDADTIVIDHLGKKEPNKIIGLISYDGNSSGLCALLFGTLFGLNSAEVVGAIPVVMWSRGVAYYDEGMDDITNNVFEYYFNPVSNVKYDEINNYKHIFNLSGIHNFCRDENYENTNWFYDDYYFEQAVYLYKKYIRLNKKTEEYISKQVAHLCDGANRILGVHVRGTDYGLGLKNHPIKISPREYAYEAKKLFATNSYDKIFLATDDVNALNLFRTEFGKKLIFYQDTFRAGNDIGLHITPNDRPLHYYKLGLEVLRDIFTLAQCDSLICGVSNVSLTAKYVSSALSKPFEKIVVLDKGINMNNSRRAEQVMRYSKKIRNFHRGSIRK